jgi:hypothetical protein
MKFTALIATLTLLPTVALSAIAADVPESIANVPVCATDQLTEIAKVIKLPTERPDTLQVRYNGRNVSIGLDNRGRVDHIGYTIFNPDQRKLLGSEIVNFIERYTLLADIAPWKGYVEKQMMEDGVNLEGCRLNKLADTVVGDDTAISVENCYGRTYKVVWNMPQKKVTMEFPLSYNLISGCDIDECERRLVQQLLEFNPDTTAVCVIPTDLQVGSVSEILVTPSDSCYVAGLTSTRYYEDVEDDIEPLYNLNYPIETMANLLTGTDIDSEFVISVKLRCYNYHDEFFNLPVNRFVGYFLAQGCKPFFGLISDEDGAIVGELVYLNRDMGYCHVLKVNLIENDLIERGGVITARMVSFIPVSRIANIFDELK